jgi:hypothetical protein
MTRSTSVEWEIVGTLVDTVKERSAFAKAFSTISL